MGVDHDETEDTDHHSTGQGRAGDLGWEGVPWSQEEEDWIEDVSPEISQTQSQWENGGA